MTREARDHRTPQVFNLIDEPWLPVRRRSGPVEHIPPWRINDRIAEDPFVFFAWPRPDFNGASHELLIGLLSTAAAPADDDEWEEWWRAPPGPEALRQRFATVAHAFDLHGPQLDGPGPRFLRTSTRSTAPTTRRPRRSSSIRRVRRRCATTRICS